MRCQHCGGTGSHATSAGFSGYRCGFCKGTGDSTPELELCCRCSEPTGHAGRGDGSIFAERTDEQGEVGPLCMHCLDELIELGDVKLGDD